MALALNHARKVHATPVHARDRGSSVASLKGTYAFRRTGVNNVVGGPIAQIGIDVFNGDGTRGLIRSTRSTNGEIRDWTDFPPNGSYYTVDPDCTGSFFDADGTKSNNFVILDGCKRFFLLSATPETITTEEGKGSTWRTNGCWVVDMRECAGRQSNPFAWRKQVAQTHFYQEYRDALVIQARCRTEASIRRRLSTRSTISPLP